MTTPFRRNGIDDGPDMTDHPLPAFRGLHPDVARAVVNARKSLGLGEANDPALVEFAMGAYAVGHSHGELMPACGCRQCPTCKVWLRGSWCDMCEETVQ